MRAEPISRRQRARLQEVVEAGLYQATSSLRVMLGGDITTRAVTGSQRFSGATVSLTFAGAIAGRIHICLPEQLAIRMIAALTAEEEPSLLHERSRSALMELGNVFASVFVGYFDQKWGLRSLPSPPQLSLVLPKGSSNVEPFTAELRWSGCQERGEVSVLFETLDLAIFSV